MPATISTLGQLISLIYLVFDYLGWGPTELGAQGGRPACPPPGPALPASQWLTSRVGTDPPVLANQTISNPHMRSRTHAATRDIKPPQQALVKLILIYLLIPKLIP